MWITVGTFLAIFVTLPITIVQFFFIFPNNIVEIYNIHDELDLTKFPIFDLTKFYWYEKNLKICYRKFFDGTIDYKVIVYFIHTVNFIAVSLIVASFIVIATVVMKSRRFKHNAGAVSTSEREQRTRHRKQNFKIARLSVISTLCVLLPWLPSMVLSVLIDVLGERMYQIGDDWIEFLLRSNQYLYYLVTWSFPLMAILTNPSVSRANKALVSNLFNQNTTIYINNAASPGPRMQKDVPQIETNL